MRDNAFLLVVVLALALVLGLGQHLGDSEAAAPLPDGRLIVVAEGAVIGPSVKSVSTVYFETDDCDTLIVFADATTVIDVYLHPSPDGIIDPAKIGGSKFSRVAGRSMTLFNPFLVAPMTAIEFERVDTIGSDTVNKAWLFCTH